MGKRVVQPEGLEEYRQAQKQLSALDASKPTGQISPPARDVMLRAAAVPQYSEPAPIRGTEIKVADPRREDLLRQAAALETPLGQTVVPADPTRPDLGLIGEGSVENVQIPFTAASVENVPVPIGGPAGYGAKLLADELVRSEAPQYPGEVPYKVYAPGVAPDPQAPPEQYRGGVLSPQEAPPKAVAPAEELSRLMEPAPAFYTGAEAVVPPYSSDVLKQVARRRTADVNADANISIPVMETHRSALADELEKPQTPEREAELRRDLERADAILKQQRAYARALKADGMYQPIEEQQQLAEILLGGSEEL
tara:strand:+ start:26119 stop:27048 length:930 start_codon:yes stop_codon:yes gene_type:complete